MHKPPSSAQPVGSGQVAQEQPEPELPPTWVTALLDLGRDALMPLFARSFEDHYLPRFAQLLPAPVPMVIYASASLHAWIWQHRSPHNTLVMTLELADLQALPTFQPVAAIRTNPDWRNQAAWLPWSPQASLPHYNPLVLQKLVWLAQQAQDNPFGSEHLFWIDAGLTHTVPAELLTSPELGRHLAAIATEPLFLAFPYTGATEIHGFSRDALAELAGCDRVERVLRGGFFGGPGPKICALLPTYLDLREVSLGAGHMGTEESLFAAMSYLQPERLTVYGLDEDGLIAPFFADLLAEQVEHRRLNLGQDPAGEEPLTGAQPAWNADGLAAALPEQRELSDALDQLFQQREHYSDALHRMVWLHHHADSRLPDHLRWVCQNQGVRCATQKIPQENQTLPVWHDTLASLGEPGCSLLVVDNGQVANAWLAACKPGDLLLLAADQPVPPTFLAVSEAIWRVSGWQLLERDWSPPVQLLGLERLVVYVLSFNAPDQFHAWIQAAREAAPEVWQAGRRILLNNTTDSALLPQYAALCAVYGFEEIRAGNLGMTGGRLYCAQHFAAAESFDFMLYCEDDLLFSSDVGSCSMGFATYLPDLLSRSLAVVQVAQLDYLKLSYTEYYGDHRMDWAWINLPPAQRNQSFAHRDTTLLAGIDSYQGVPYAVGKIYYSNWPMLVSRQGNAALLTTVLAEQTEAHMMVAIHHRQCAGELRTGVLLASPIVHQRVQEYTQALRREHQEEP